MWNKESALFLFLTIAGYSLGHLVYDEPIYVGAGEHILPETLSGKNTVLLQSEDLEYSDQTKVPIQADEYFDQDENNEGSSYQRVRRQTQPTTSILDSVTQECDGITLRWIRPNIPFSVVFHNDNPQFSHYNIYRETSYYSTVIGLTPLIAGKDIQKLQNILTNKWTDKFPPSGTGLFYVVTVVDHNGKETQNVSPKQITFYGSVEKADSLDPVRLIPSILKGNVLHHSLAYNSFRNEYMVVFDLDLNKDNKPDHVYGIRVNGLGQIIDRRVLNASVSTPTTEQGHPSVAFNPTTQQYLIAFQLSAPSLFQGASVIIGQRVYAHKTARYQNPYVLLKVTKDGKTFISSRKPKLIYNSGSGGFAMSVLIDNSPTTAVAVFVKGDGDTSSIQPVFKGEVFEMNVFMDTKVQQVYFVFQVAQWQATITSAKQGQKYTYNYVITVAKANATGGWLKLTDPTSIRHLVGFANEKNGNIAGYFNEKNGWLTVFWNDKVNGRQIIRSSNILGRPGVFAREENLNSCPTQNNVQNPSSCFLPNNNAHILLWEQGVRILGHLVRDDTFTNPLFGQLRQPQLIYNQIDHKAFVVWKQKSGGNVVLFARNIVPGSRFTCTPSCSSTMKCSMKNVCSPKNPGILRTSCAKNNGGCSHTCLNVKDRKCTCPLSYSLALDEMKCYAKDEKPDVSLLYSSKGSIWSISIYYQSKRTSYTKIPVQGKEIISFFYNKNDKYLYWADAGEHKIYRAFLDGSNKQLLVANQVLLPDGMVVDPDANQLYWTDAILGVIFRSSLDGTNKISFVSLVDKPRTLAFHRKNKWLYWTNWGNVAKIERINSDGSNRKVVISNGLVWPNGLTLDDTKLYWADAKLHAIEMSDLNGNGRVAITKTGVKHPYGLGVAGSRLFWTDWIGDIRMVDKSNSFNVVVVATGIKKPYTLQIYDGTAVNKAKFCSDPGVPKHGGRNPVPDSNGKYKVAQRIVLTCNPGFVLLGSNNRACSSTGKWTGTETQCKARPVLTHTPTNITTEVSTSITLLCSAEKITTIITWYKNNQVIKPSTNARYFQIIGGFYYFNTFQSDTGTYTCVAKNDAGQVRASMFLNVTTRPSDCGKAKFSARQKIIGGIRAEPGEIPWQVLLWDTQTQKPFCGGALLNTRWMVTAAHCLKYTRLSSVKLILGEYNWKKDEKNEQYFSIEKMHEHSQYSTNTLDSDITLVKFNTPVIMTDYVQPICLPESKSDQALLKTGNDGIISGWGARHTSKDKTVKTLHKVTVPIASDKMCKSAFSSHLITKNMFCAGVRNGTADACRGDSGGPLTIFNSVTRRFVLTGIVSWGDTDKCGVKDKYGVYTKVQKYLRWIKTTIKEL